MWWLIRAGVAIGGAVLMGELLGGCSRRREEDRPGGTNGSSSSSPPVPSVTTPPGSAPSVSLRPPLPTLPAISREECNRRFIFDSPASRRPVRNPISELQNLESALAQIETHVDDLRNENYSAFANDAELNRRTTPLEMRDLYLREGLSTLVDTESDIMNLYAARDWLIRLRDATTYYPDSPNSQQMTTLWAGHQLWVGFQGFLFRDNEVPHLNGRAGTAGEVNRFRLITPNNFDRFPVLSACNIQASQFHIWRDSRAP